MNVEKGTPTSKKSIVGTWKKAQNEDNLWRGIKGDTYTFREDGRFIVDRDFFLEVANGTYTVNADLLTITATSTILGEVPLFKIHIAAKIKSMSENEIVLELEEKNHAILAKFVRIPIPVGAWQAIEQDSKRLQGTWEYVVSEKDGKPFKEKSYTKPIVINGDKIQALGEKEYGKITLRANRKLKSIQFRFTNGIGTAVLYAYELEGNRLRICGAGGQVFPEEFKTKGTKNQIDEYRRVTK